MRPPGSARFTRIIFESDTPAGKAFDIALLFAIGASVLVVMLESVKSIQTQHAILLRDLEWIFTGLFTVEYILRLLCVRRPLQYAWSFYGFIDLIAILPSYINLFTSANYVMVIRIVRLLRVFRVLKLAHFLQETETLIAALRASSRKIVVFLFSVLALATIMGTVMYLVEGEAERLHQHPAQRLLGDRHSHHRRLRRHHAAHHARPVHRQPHHDHGLRHHRRADRNFLARTAGRGQSAGSARLRQMRHHGIRRRRALLPPLREQAVKRRMKDEGRRMKLTTRL